MSIKNCKETSLMLFILQLRIYIKRLKDKNLFFALNVRIFLSRNCALFVANNRKLQYTKKL